MNREKCSVNLLNLSMSAKISKSYDVKLANKGKTPIFMTMYDLELAKSLGESFDEYEIYIADTDELICSSSDKS